MALTPSAVTAVHSGLTKKASTISASKRATHESLAGYSKLARKSSRKNARTGSRLSKALARSTDLKKKIKGSQITGSLFKGLKMKVKKLGEAVVNHSREFIASLAEAVANNKGTDLNIAAIMEASPRLTSTPEGQYALTVLSKLVENEQVFAHFLDMEFVENSTVMYFTAPTAGSKLKEEATKILEAFGAVEVVAQVGDAIGEGVKSELLVLALSPAAETVESFYDDMSAELVEEESEESEESDDADLEEESEDEDAEDTDLEEESDDEEEEEEVGEAKSKKDDKPAPKTDAAKDDEEDDE